MPIYDCTPDGGGGSGGSNYIAGNGIEIQDSVINVKLSQTEDNVAKFNDDGLYVEKIPSGKKYATVVVGTSTSGYTKDQVDFLCDGINDDVEINNAIQSLKDSGGKVVILEGTYYIGATISVNKENIFVCGCGDSTIINGGSGYNGVFIIVYSNNFKISNIKFIGSSGESSGNTCISVQGGENVCIEKNTFTNFAYCISTSNQSIGTKIIENYFENVFRVHSGGIKGGEIIQNIANNLNYGFIGGGTGIESCIISNNIIDTSKSPVIILNGLGESKISGNIFLNCQNTVISCGNASYNSIISENILKNVYAFLDISNASSENIKVDYNIIDTCSSNCVNISSSKSSINGNNIKNCNNGIYIRGDNCVVSGNMLDTTSVSVRIDSDNNIVTGNNFVQVPPTIYGSGNIVDNNIGAVV